MQQYTIGIISEHASPLALLGGVDGGGQNVYVSEIAHHLGEMGYQVDVFTRWDNPDLPQHIQVTEQVRVVHIEAGPKQFVRKEDLLPYMDDFTAGILRWMKKQHIRYDLFHANFFMSGLVAANIKAESSIPFVVTFHALGKVRLLHQGSADEFPKERFAIEKYIIEEADCVIAECPQDRNDLVEHYEADPRKIAVIPCGVNLQQFKPMPKHLARALLKLPQDEAVILQLGRIVPRKGVENVIRALAHLKAKHGINAHLLIVGGNSSEPDPTVTPEIGRLQAVAEDIGIAPNVTFTGRKDRRHLHQYYSAADVFVTTPWYEPFGITPLEAMACGTPVVGSNVGGIQYTVLDQETGYLVPPEDPVKLASRLQKLLTEPKLAHQMGRNAIERVQSRFTWKIVSQSLEGLYHRVIQHHSELSHNGDALALNEVTKPKQGQLPL
jgi:D-inositol-3-phosphate glycosyltransferase